jgi:hypothetical protein
MVDFWRGAASLNIYCDHIEMNAPAANPTGGLHLVQDGKGKDSRPRRRWPWIVGILVILWVGALLEARHVM